jgi:hypothetical protein
MGSIVRFFGISGITIFTITAIYGVGILTGRVYFGKSDEPWKNALAWPKWVAFVLLTKLGDYLKKTV